MCLKQPDSPNYQTKLSFNVANSQALTCCLNPLKSPFGKSIQICDEFFALIWCYFVLIRRKHSKPSTSLSEEKRKAKVDEIHDIMVTMKTDHEEAKSIKQKLKWGQKLRKAGETHNCRDGNRCRKAERRRKRAQRGGFFGNDEDKTRRPKGYFIFSYPWLDLERSHGFGFWWRMI